MNAFLRIGIVAAAIAVAAFGQRGSDAWERARDAAGRGDRMATVSSLRAAYDEGVRDRAAIALDLADLADAEGRTAEALAWTLRAARADPRDRDVLEATTARTRVARASAAPTFAGRVRRFLDGLPRGPWTALVLGVGFSGAGLVALGRRSRIAVAAGILSLAGMVALIVDDARRSSGEPLAVVVSDGVILRAEPHAERPSGTRVSTGSVVVVLADSGAWTHVAIDGRRGFVEGATLMRVDPGSR